ncbi:hypothetical protein N658DRAFT_501265 [Parathielavia hyrcaniae]|uniref:Uncharacterized protein n=1 Tax=Parathielavia hyrcaniae TaxID=113614 RepID=A0AAN6PTE5_9PEZI|nr:hypothetical protein N658DRAFT_501265 [Parathielavia hyrcaniae]
MFIDGDSEDLMYAASIIGACADQTTYALRCTSGPRYYSEACNPTAPIITVTGGPGTYRVYSATTTRTMDYDVSATMQESCELRGTTAAVCSATIGGSVDGTTTSESITTTLSGTDYYRYDVAITGGADKTANPTAECPAPSPAPGQSGASTKAVAMWGMVGAAGVTSLLGLW